MKRKLFAVAAPLALVLLILTQVRVPAGLPRLRTLLGHTFYVSSVAYSPDGRMLASGSYDGSVKLWDPGSGLLERTLKEPSSLVTSVAFSPDGKTVASGITGTDFRQVRLWDARSGVLMAALAHPETVTSVAFSPDGRLLATACADNQVRLWTINSDQVLAQLTGHSSRVWSVVFCLSSCNQQCVTLATGSEDKTIKVWEVHLPSGQVKLLNTLHGHGDTVRALALSPNGRTLASGSFDETVKLWDLPTGALLRTLTGHNDKVTSLAFSPDGRLLASGSFAQVRFWDAYTGRLLLPPGPFWVGGTTGYVTGLAFSPNGHTLASGSWDRTVKLWDVALLQHPSRLVVPRQRTRRRSTRQYRG